MHRTALAIASAAALLAPAAARADEELTASFNNKYDATTVTIDQGEKLTFRNNDLKRHDVTSEAPGNVNGFLFQSPLIDNGQAGTVEGVEFLTTGDYRFLCSVHPEMKGTLVVTSAGTPAQRPGSGPTDTLKPVVQLSADRPKAKKLRKTRKLKVRLGSSEAGEYSIGGARVSEGTISAEVIEVTLRFSKRFAKKFKKGYKLLLAASVTDAAGNTKIDRLTLKLR